MEAFRIWLQEEPALFLGAAAALMLMSGSLYERQREHKTTQTLMLKGGTTLIAALVAGAAVWQQNSLAARFVLAATLCCAVADVLLEQIFNFGACVFALGHIWRRIFPKRILASLQRSALSFCWRGCT